MLTVTNAFTPHLFPFPVRPEPNNNNNNNNNNKNNNNNNDNQPQYTVNHPSAHAINDPVFHLPHKYFSTGLPAHFNHPNSIPTQTNLSPNQLAFKTSTPTGISNHSQGFEPLPFPVAPGHHMPFLPQRLGCIETVSLPSHFDTSPPSRNLAKYRDVHFGMASINGGVLPEADTKGTGNRIRSVANASNIMNKVPYHNHDLQSPLSFLHPHVMIQKVHSHDSNTTTGQEQTTDSIDTSFIEEKESHIEHRVTNSKFQNIDSSTLHEVSQNSVLTSSNLVLSSRDLNTSSQQMTAADSSHTSFPSSHFVHALGVKLSSFQHLSPNRMHAVSNVDISPEDNDRRQKGFGDCTSEDELGLKSPGRPETQEDVGSGMTKADVQDGEGTHADDAGSAVGVDMNIDVDSQKDGVIIVEDPCSQSGKMRNAMSLRHSIESILSRNQDVSQKANVWMPLDETDGQRGDCIEMAVDDHQEGSINLVDDDDDDLEENAHELHGEKHDSISVISDETDDDGVEIEEIDSEKGYVDVDVVSRDGTPPVVSSTSDGRDHFNDDESLMLKNRSPTNRYEQCDNSNKCANNIFFSIDDERDSSDNITDNKYFSSKTETSYKLKNLEANLENSPLYINQHLKRLEGLITKENTHHFQKDEFFQARMQILRSVSKNCKLMNNGQQGRENCHQHFGLEGRFRANDVEPNSCTATTHASTLPPFHSFIPTGKAAPIHQCSPFCLCHQPPRHVLLHPQYCPQMEARRHKQLFRSAGQYRDENLSHPSGPLQEEKKEENEQQKEAEKSAFRPIRRRHHHHHMSPATPTSSSRQPEPDSTISGLGLPTRSSVSHPSIAIIGDTTGLPARRTSDVGDSSSDSPKNTSNNNNNDDINNASSLLDDPVNLDAISLLRFRSNAYHQCPPGALPASFAYSSNTTPNPEAVNVWLSWLRSRNPEVIRSNPLEPIQTVLSKVPPPPRYHCGDCNKTYSTFGGLSKHRQFHCALHVKKEFACKICTKSYSSLGALKMHIRTHTLPCKCHICGKAFSRPWLLQGHVRTHTGEKPFRCNHCGRAFADRSNLRAHLQTHAEIKKYACVKCGKTFSRMSLLTKHSDGSCPANASSCI